MKKKFLSLAPLKVPSRSDLKLSLRSANAILDYSPPPTPYSTRRPPLDPQTEDELREACTVVFHGQAPVTGPAPEKPLGGVERTKSSASDCRRANAHTRGRSEPKAGQISETSHATSDAAAHNKFAYKPGVPTKDLFPGLDSTHPTIQANALRRKDSLSKAPGADAVGHRPRTSQGAQRAQEQDPNRPSVNRTRSHDRPKATARTDSFDTGSSSPHTDTTTDNHWNASSTAPTSVAITPARSARMSKNDSSVWANDADVASRVDAAAAEWMKQELEKRRVKNAWEERFGQGATDREYSRGAPSMELARPPSRASSFREGIMNYIKPGSSRQSSRPVSRSRSRDSRTSMDGASVTSQSSSMSHRFRSWSLTRKVNDGWNSWRISRPGSSDGNTEPRGRACNREEINLNRPLPKLPGLDQWKEEDNPQPTLKSVYNNTHIAGMVRQQDIVDVPKNSGVVRSPPPLASPPPPPKDARTTSLKSRIHQSSPSVQDPENSKPGLRASMPKTIDSDNLVPVNTRMSSTKPRAESPRHDSLLYRADSRAAQRQDRPRKTPSSALSPNVTTHTKSSSENERNDMMNFSRKLSQEQVRRYQPMVPDQGWPTQVKEHRSIKKMFSGVRLGKKSSKHGLDVDRRNNHPQMPPMHHEGAAASPVIRY